MAAKKDSKSIEIPALTKRLIEVDITGVAPLITHRMTIGKVEPTANGEKQLIRPPRDPEAEFRSGLYVMTDGAYGFPAIGIKRAMISAAGRFTTAVQANFMGSFSIPADLLRLDSPSEPTMRADRVKIGINTTTVAYRPQFDPWQITVPLSYIGEFVSMDKLVNILRIAGVTVGIGDWRIEKKGNFGTWDIGAVRQIT